MFLVTHSLHSAWSWYRDSETIDKAEFLGILNKVEREPTEAMLLGRQFEDDVEHACRMDAPHQGEDAYARCVNEAAAQVGGGLWQEKVYRTVMAAGVSILLYGKADVVKRNWIYDLKRTANYDIGKYTGSIQHPLYMFCSGLHNFRYIITDGRSIWHEDYRYDSDMKTRMLGEIASMLECIFQDRVLGDAYSRNWLARDKEAA